MKHVAATNVSSALGTTGWTEVKSAFTYSPTSGGYDMINFDSPFVWNGTDNIGVELCWSQVAEGWSPSGQARIYTTTNGYRYSWTDNAGNSCGLTPGTVNTSKPQARIGYYPLCFGTPTPGNAIASTTSLCENFPLDLSLQNDTYGSGISYQWQKSTDGSSWSNVPGANSEDYSLTLSETTFFRCNVTCSGSTGTSNPIEISVLESPIITSQPTDLVLCEGESGSFEVESSTTGLNYDWEIEDPENLGVWTSLSLNNNTLLLEDIEYFYNNWKARAVLTKNTCTLYSDEVRLTVNQNPSNVNAGADEIICFGESVELNGTADGPSTIQTFHTANSSDDFSSFTTNDTDRWLITASSNAGGTSEEFQFQYYDGSNGTIITAWVRSALLDSENYESLSLSFSHYIDHYASTFPLALQTSTDGSSWTTQWTDTYSSTTGPETITVDISSVAGESFYYRFLFDGNIWNIDYWYIDDIEITGNYVYPVSYAWTPDINLSSTVISNPTADPESTQIYTMTATSNGCSSTSEVTVYVDGLLTSPESITAPETICLGSEIELTSVGGVDVPTSTLNWMTEGAPVFVEEWFSMDYTTSNSTVNSAENGILNITSTSGDPMINMFSLGDFDPNIYKYIQVRYRVISGDAGNCQIYYKQPSYALSESRVINQALNNDGEWHILNIDMSASANWTVENITGWRFDYSTNSGVEMEIDYIALSSGKAIDQGETISFIAMEDETYFVQRRGGCSNSATAETDIIVTRPSTDGISEGDYLWSGGISSEWINANNWLVFSSGDFEIAEDAPDVGTNVLLKSFGDCPLINPNLTEVSTINNIVIESGKTFEMSENSTIEIKGDWTNSGGTFIAGNGTIVFSGTSKQSIVTDGDSFNNITINNSSLGTDNIEILDAMQIEGTANFINGIINFDLSGSIVFGESASSNIGTNSSFINGEVSKIGSTEFTFPTGHVNERELVEGSPETFVIWAPFTANPSESTTVKVRYIFDNKDLPVWWYHDWTHEAPLNHTSDREYWLVESGADLNSVSMHWKESQGDCVHTLCDGTLISEDLITVTYWDGIWKDASSSITPGSTSDNGSITSGLIPFSGSKNGGTPIGFGGKDSENPLPIELANFEIICDNGKANILWTTATEINNDFFTIEKSTDLKEFEEIAVIPGNGFSNSNIDYQVTDYDTKEGYSYYRLKQTDYDGTSTTFQIIQANCNIKTNILDLNIFPNPFNSEITINLSDLDSDFTVIEIFTQDGKLIYIETIKDVGNISTYTLDLSSLDQAIYMLRLTTENESFTSKIIKK